MSDAVPPVPTGSAVLHIGPHKTGTSALQMALRRGRADLLEQGVLVAGPGDTGDGDGVRYAIGGRPMAGEEAGRRAWEQITADLTDASAPRRVFSRETFANASDNRARRVVADLTAGGTRLHVVVSARPLAELIPSQYSQFVQRGSVRVPFDAWSAAVLAGDTEDRSVRLFWKRHSHDEQVRRWADLVGPANVTVVVVDRRDRAFLPRTFEQLLDVRPGTLSEQTVSDRDNRSLTLTELELLRQWHEVTADADVDRARIVRLSWRLAQHLRRFNPDPTDPRPTLSAASRAEANRQAAEAAAAIMASGVRVVGDLGALSAVPAEG